MAKLGSLDKLYTTIGPLKMSDKTEGIKMNVFTLLIGMNGSGKSLILKLIWVVNYLSTMHTRGINKSDLSQVCQMLLNHTFTNQKFTGEINGDFTNLRIDINLTDGIIDKFEVNQTESLDPIESVPLFMSTKTRTFGDMSQYLKTKKLLALPDDLGKLTGKQFNKLSELYRIYDIFFVEQISIKRKTPLKIPDTVKESMKDSKIITDIETIYCDFDKSDFFYINKAGETKSLSTLSAGEQSMINMLTANL